MWPNLPEMYRKRLARLQPMSVPDPFQPSRHEISKTTRLTTPRPRLTAGSVAVVAEVLLLKVAAHPRLVPHCVDLRHAEPRVGLEEEAAVADGQIVLFPVPQVLQLLVVERSEGVRTAGQR